MDDKILEMLGELGTKGIDAFYVYLALDYISAWVVIWLCVVGVRAVWKKVKDSL